MTAQKTKYDWDGFLAEYLAGDLQDASVFMKVKLGKENINGWIREKIDGWPVLWKENRKKIAEAVLAKANKDRSKSMAKALENIRNFFEGKTNDPKMSINDAKEVWKIIRVENNLPSNISRNIVSTPQDPEDTLNQLRINEGSSTPENPPEIQDHTTQ